jgi:hypothetical protein
MNPEVTLSDTLVEPPAAQQAADGCCGVYLLWQMKAAGLAQS